MPASFSKSLICSHRSPTRGVISAKSCGSQRSPAPHQPEPYSSPGGVVPVKFTEFVNKSHQYPLDFRVKIVGSRPFSVAVQVAVFAISPHSEESGGTIGYFFRSRSIPTDYWWRGELDIRDHIQSISFEHSEYEGNVISDHIPSAVVSSVEHVELRWIHSSVIHKMSHHI